MNFVEIVPLAADSLGTRSMATYVETRNARILIDPGVALAPRRSGLGPHRLEVERLLAHWDAIKSHATSSDILIITHYHFDHYNPREPELFRGKTLFIKNPKKNINRSQKSRSAGFLHAIQGLPKEVIPSDGGTFEFGGTRIEFSQAVPHGESTQRGCVTEVLVEEDERFIFTSDVQGPLLPVQTQFILEGNPDVLYSDGGMAFEEALPNMARILKETNVRQYVIDHHFTRDAHYATRLEKVRDIAREKRVEVMTAAEYSGQANDLLESKRKKLYEEFP